MTYRNIFILLVFLVCHAAIFSCKKPEHVNPAILPYHNLINGVYDGSQKISAYTILQDSVASDETSLNLAGYLNDPVFGKTQAGFYAQLHLTGVAVDFGTAPVLDSIVLCLAYYSYYGDTLTPLHFNAKQLAWDIFKDSIYNSRQTFPTSTFMGSATRAPRPTDSVFIAGVYTPPHLRMRLSDIFGNTILGAAQGGHLVDNSSFVAWFKGICVYADDAAPRKGAVMYFDLLNPQSKMTVYYNHGSWYDFIFDSNSARINYFAHNYSGTEVNRQLTGIASDTNYVYIQGTSGTSSRIIFPNIKHLGDSGKVAVNKAELVLTLGTGSTDQFSPPDKLVLARVDSTGTNVFLSDQVNGTSYFGGDYDPVNRQFVFNLAKYVQEVVNGNYTDHGLNLLPSGSAVSASRVVIGGPNSNDVKMKLNIVYTRY